MNALRRIAFLVLPLAGCAAHPPSSPPPAAAQISHSAEMSAKAAFESDAELPSVPSSGEKGIFVEESASGPATPRKPSAARAGNAPRPSATPVAATAKRRYRGLSYWIDRDRNGSQQRVTASSVFRGGDQVRIHVRSSLNGYLYAVAQGTSGNTRIIYPAGANQVMPVEANRTYTIPKTGAIVFDNRPGNEVLWLFLTQRPLKQTPQPATNPQMVASADTDYNGCGTKDLLLTPDSLDGDCGLKRSGGGTKDLLVQDDAAAPEPAGYVVGNVDQLEQGRLLSVRLVLQHE